MTYATEHIAHTLKRAREARGLSQRALSAKAGVLAGDAGAVNAAQEILRI